MIHISKPFIGQEEKQAVIEVLESGFLVQGERTKALEDKFAEICDVKHAIAVTSGTSALYLALLANKIQPGDEVITTSFTFIATVNSILFAGAKPVFIDIDEETYNMDVSLLERAITSKTKAIMPVHLYGCLCNMDKIMEVAAKNDLKVIEDACQSVNASQNGKFAGGFGTGAFSLYATKNVMTGEGGIITTNDDEVADRCQLLRNHGMRTRYKYETMGFNFRITDMQSAIGLAQMDRLDDFTQKRRENAEYYNENIHSVITPKEPENYRHVWHQYTVRVKESTDRDEAVANLHSAGIGVGIYYPIPLHEQQYVIDMVGKYSLPVTEKASREVFSLPVHPLLTDDELEKVVTEVNKL